MDALLAAVTGAAERGRIPDAAVRWGIRRLCGQRLRQEAARWPAGNEPAALARFLDSLRESEIAAVPDKANEQHYEVPVELFRLMLGPRLKYSACLWDDGVVSLAEAEVRALRVTAAHALIEDGMQVLELGCGWGSLSLWLAEAYPRCAVVGVSNSGSQHAFIEAEARARRLPNLTIVTADINGFDPGRRFDRVVSVEMFEHIRNHRRLLERIARWLQPDGRLFVHVFRHRRHAYLFETAGAHNWMGRNFFTGGMMPSADLLPAVAAPFVMEDRWDWDGTHYARSADAWLARLDAHRAAALGVLARAYGPSEAGHWLARWRIFLMACSELFGYAGGREWGVTHYRFAPRLEVPGA
jgi:cyclopropane-fatty-acyl-phospholipid synthase